jgi:large subunit ribosomal protein L21
VPPWFDSNAILSWPGVLLGAVTFCTVVAHGKHEKVTIFKMRRRKHYQKRQGHRQQFTELQIGAIAG